MVNRRELILFGLLLGTISLALGQDKTANVTPNNLPIAVPAVQPGTPPSGDNPMEEPAARLHELAVLYNGESTLPPQITMGGWGLIQQDATFKPFEPKRLGVSLHSPYYLYIMSMGRYEGVRFDFPQPLPAAELLRAKNVFLELYVRAYVDTSPAKPDVSEHPGARGGIAAMTAAMQAKAAVTSATITPWMSDTSSTPSSDTEGKLPESAYPKEMRSPSLSVPLPQVTNIRFTFFTEKGSFTIVEPLEAFFPKEVINRQWIRIGIPLSALDPSIPVGSKLTRLVITSDKLSAFCLGRMAFVKDESPIVIHPLIYPAFIEMGKRIFFSARPEFGLTHVVTTWSFANGSGTPINVKGDRTTFTFDKEGTYTVTCTVSDPSGGKEPVKQDIEVKVSHPKGPGTQVK